LPMRTAQRERVEATFEVMSLEEYRERHPELQGPIEKALRKEMRRMGLTEGLGRGREEGARELFVTFWRAWFGKPPGRTAAQRIKTASVGTRLRWATHLVRAKRPADVFD
jgi:hypothetical protein